MSIEQFDKIEAAYQPRRTDDLVDGAAEWIGKTTTWQASWIIEHGPYAGDWAMGAVGRECPPFAWAPLCDLEVRA